MPRHESGSEFETKFEDIPNVSVCRLFYVRMECAYSLDGNGDLFQITWLDQSVIFSRICTNMIDSVIIKNFLLENDKIFEGVNIYVSSEHNFGI